MGRKLNGIRNAVAAGAESLIKRVLRGPARRWLRDLRQGRLRISSIDVVVHQTSDEIGAQNPAATVRSVEAAAELGRMQGLDVLVRTEPNAADETPCGHKHLVIHLSAGVTVAQHALVRLVAEFDNNADLELCYSDGAGRGDQLPILLPGHSPERLTDEMYIGHLLAFRDSTVATALDQSWAVAAERARTIHRAAHIPERLYIVPPVHKPDLPVARSTAHTAGVKRFAFDRSHDHPLVSIVIPTRGGRRTIRGRDVILVEQTVASILAEPGFDNFEIVVVTTPGTPDALPQCLEALSASCSQTLVIAEDNRPFNFSNACNRGALIAQGDVLVFLNDDTEVISTDWLDYLVVHAMNRDIGAVGARLLYENGTVQHAGIWCRGGHPIHRYEGWLGDDPGYRGALTVAQNCLAVTGACLAVDRSKFMTVGGFSPAFPNSYNDVDLCLKLLDHGWRTVVEPRAELYHYEASSRDPQITDHDMVRLHDRWRRRLTNDPFDNPTHQARLSEELPLPESTYVLSGAIEHRVARHWPLPPLVADRADMTALVPRCPLV